MLGLASWQLAAQSCGRAGAWRAAPAGVHAPPAAGLAAQQPAAAEPGEAPGAYVVLSSGARPLYAFMLPLAALTWSRRLGVPPLILLVNDAPSGTGVWGSDNVTALVLRQLAAWGMERSVSVLDHDRRRPSNNVVVSQVARAYAASSCCARGALADALAADAFLITSDVDILPVAPRSYFLPARAGSIGRVTNAYFSSAQTVSIIRGAPFRELPMSTMAFSATAWRRLMRTDDKEACRAYDTASGCLSPGLTDRINADLTDVLGLDTPRQAVDPWFADQMLCSYRLASQPELLNATELVARDTAVDRIDRAAWPAQPLTDADLGRYVDAHVLRPGWTVHNWDRLAPLLHLLLRITDAPADQALWAQVTDYALAFRALQPDEA